MSMKTFQGNVLFLIKSVALIEWFCLMHTQYLKVSVQCTWVGYSL